MKRKITLTILAVGVIFNLHSQTTLKTYIDNKFHMSSLIDNIIKEDVDSAKYFAYQILNSQDKTFSSDVYYQLSILHYVKIRKCTSSVFSGKYSYYELFDCMQHHRNLYLQYIDSAVMYGMLQDDIILDYDSLRYAKNRAIYEHTFYNKELVNLLNTIDITDQGNRAKYRTGDITGEEMVHQDSINCELLKNWIIENGWPEYLSLCNDSISRGYEISAMSAFISHYGRKNSIFFLDKAYRSAIDGKSSWNQVYAIYRFIYWKFPYKRYTTENNKYYATISPLLYLFTDSISGKIDLDSSMFAILGVADQAQFFKILILPTKKYRKEHPEVALSESNRLRHICSRFGVSVSFLPLFRTEWFLPFCDIIKTENYDTDFYLVFFYIDISTQTDKYGSPSIIEYSKIQRYDFDIIFEK